MQSLQKYQENGQKIFETFCSSSKPNSIMFPKAPEQTYVDIYPGPEQDKPGSDFRDERQRQADYEAEVSVYRALEGLEKNLIVLHSFKYTHDQSCPIRNRKVCKKCTNSLNIDGECDFLVLSPDFCVIIEVKNMLPVEDNSNTRDTEIKALVGTFRKSVGQATKIKCLINNIDQNTTVLQFTAYPNFSESCKGQFQENADSALTAEELSTIIFKEDICGKISHSEERTSLSEVAVSANQQSGSEQSCFSRFVTSITCCWNRDTDSGRQILVMKEVTSASGVSTSPFEEFPTDETSTSTSSTSTSHVSKSTSSPKDLTFSVWWGENVTRNVASAQMTVEVRNILLAIWCTEKKSCDLSKCSLGRCIMDIDKQLREGLISLQTKKGRKRDQNPEIFVAPPVIKNNIGVANLTAQQNAVFHSCESLMWINGPAGAGKSVLLCGKMIQLAQGVNNNKVLLFRQRTGKDNNTNKLYENALDKVNVQYKLRKWSSRSASDKLTSSKLRKHVAKSKCSVTIVEINHGCSAYELTRILSELNNCHVFIDDIQQIINFTFTRADNVSALLDKLLELSLQHSAWVACDIAQWWSILVSSMRISNSGLRELLDPIVNKLSERQVTSLSMNLRNTRDISDVLCVIRGIFVERQSKHTRRELLDMFLPKQLSGHFIYGPKITFHILNFSNQLSNVLNYELDKLTSADNNVLNNSEVCIVYQYGHQGNASWRLPSIVDTRCRNTDDKIALCDSWYSYSAEWPAVIVSQGVSRNLFVEDYLRPLYLMLSRARVYCSVILYPEEEGDKVDNYRCITRMLDNIKDHAHIVQH